jgi:hypothetical protein
VILNISYNVQKVSKLVKLLMLVCIKIEIYYIQVSCLKKHKLQVVLIPFVSFMIYLESLV